MKKVISVLLSVVMLFGCVALTASAVVTHGELVVVGSEFGQDVYEYKYEGQCTCEDHISGSLCHCCVKCPTLDTDYLTDCAGRKEGKYDGTVCCKDCDGISEDNNCTCGSCVEKDENLSDFESGLDNLIPEQDKQSFVDGFQSILKQISDAFDKFFDAIFAFLRLEEILGITL